MGVIHGGTGSGKRTAIQQLVDSGLISHILSDAASPWPGDKAIVSAIAEKHGDTGAAIDRLSAVGLNSLPQWLKPFSSLSKYGCALLFSLLVHRSKCQAWTNLHYSGFVFLLISRSSNGLFNKPIGPN